MEQRIVTTERELAIVNYVRRRLAFSVSEEVLFNAIERIDHKDYIGKLAVYYDRERKGRSFDFIEGRDGFDKFIFPDPHGEIVTNNILDIDGPLQATFTARGIGLPQPPARLAQIASHYPESRVPPSDHWSGDVFREMRAREIATVCTIPDGGLTQLLNMIGDDDKAMRLVMFGNTATWCVTLTDAVLGAAGAGDIGQHFPNTDPRCKDAAGSILLTRAVAIAAAKGWSVGNADVTVILERPRLAPACRRHSREPGWRARHRHRQRERQGEDQRRRGRGRPR